jgi:hypothetical protein
MDRNGSMGGGGGHMIGLGELWVRATRPEAAGPVAPPSPRGSRRRCEAARRHAGASLHVPSTGPAPSSSINSAPHVHVPSAVQGPVIRPSPS